MNTRPIQQEDETTIRRVVQKMQGRSHRGLMRAGHLESPTLVAALGTRKRGTL